MQSQINTVFEIIENGNFSRQDVEFDYAGAIPRFRFKKDPQFNFSLTDASRDGLMWQVEYSPAGRIECERKNVGNWAAVLNAVAEWLRYVGREIAASERAAQGLSAPEWALAELPGDYLQTVEKISQLQEVQRRMVRLSGLLWQTGEPLNKIVRDAFRSFGYQAELTTAGATFDVDVTIGTGRLLLEVTGIEGQITKGSKKIAQVLEARRTVAQPGDRVGIVVNAFRERPLADRKALEVVTPEALALLIDLKAVIVTGAELFRLWKSAHAGADVRPKIDHLVTCPPGLVTF